MPSDPFRLQVMKAVTERLKTITPANGYMHDLSDFTDQAGRTVTRVSRGRLNFGASDEVPFLAVLEDPRAIDANNAKDETPVAENKMRLLIQGVGTRFDKHFDRAWRSDETRGTRLVVIGQQLDQAAIANELRTALA